MVRRSRRSLGGLALSLAALVLGLGVAELLVRITGLEHRLLVRTLFFQGADVPVHRRSADPFLHYELRPQAKYQGSFPGKPAYAVSIDEHGARFPTHPMVKAPGTFRILGFGGSTLYGGAVNDSETMAAALERRLNRTALAPLHFEVWNFGTSAYTLGQAAHLARQKLLLLSPDLIIVQHHNRGRRAFLIPEDFRPASYPHELLVADPHLYREHFRTPPLLPEATHWWLMRQSAVYRSLATSLPFLTDLTGHAYGDHLSAAEARALTSEAAALRVPVIYFVIPASRQVQGRDTIYAELPDAQFIDLYRPNREPAFYEVHPPAATLDELASLLVDELRERRLLPERPE